MVDVGGRASRVCGETILNRGQNEQARGYAGDSPNRNDGVDIDSSTHKGVRMITELIAQYVGNKGVMPYAVLVNPLYIDEDVEFPDDVFIMWTLRVNGAQVVPFQTAIDFIYNSVCKVEVLNDGQS